MKEEAAKITRRYLGGKTLVDFADSLGINVSKQNVWAWKEGKQMPDMLTLQKVLHSSDSTPEARKWAQEIMALYLG